MKDHGTPERKALIAGTQTMADKLRRAKETLGERYLCHPSNHVKKAPHKTPEIARTDVARTFRRFRERNHFDLVAS